MDIREFSHSLMERLQGSAAVKTVYGEPAIAEGKTIIPVARVTYGFGGGFGRMRRQPAEAHDSEQEGGGGGAGVAVTPVGVIEVTPADTRFIAFGDKRKLAAAMILGLFLGLLIGRRRPRS